MAKLELWYPVKPWIITQKFGQNLNPLYKKLDMKGHNGIDAVVADGQIVRASHDGVVTFAGEDGSGGYGIVVRTNEVFDYSSGPCYFKTVYWHLKPGTFRVKAGQTVSVGDALAGADNTGLSTSTHLHFGSKPVAQGENDWQWYNVEQNNGYKGAIDPLPYCNGYYAENEQIVIAILSKLRDAYQQLIGLLTKGR